MATDYRAKLGKLPSRPWWLEDEGRVAGALYSWALGVEYYSYRRRARNTVLYRLATGEEPPLTLGLWMSRKVAAAVSGFGSNYLHPHRNVIRNACDVLENRIGTIRPFVEIAPNDVDFSTREACGDLEDFVDTLFDDKGVYDLTRLGFRDCFTWGMCFIKVTASDDGEDIQIERVLPDDILVDEPSAVLAPPRHMAQRRYISRNDAFEVWGGKSKEIDAAIRTAPAAIIGTHVAGTQLGHDMVCVLEGWKLPSPTGDPGRHVMTLGDAALVDEPWTRARFPFAVGRWQPQTMGYYSVGAAFDMSPAQMEINIKWEQIRACQRAMAYPRWLVATGSKVTAKSLGGRPGAVHEFQGQAPQPIVPIAVNGEMYEDAERWENFAYSVAGITQQQAQGQKQPGINAGVAIRLMVDVEDTRNKSRQIMLEDLVRDIADLVIDVSGDVNLEVVVPGANSRTIRYADLAAKRDKIRIKKFPINALSATPEAKAQQISEWYADGTIDKRAYFRLQQMPDLASYAKKATASDDLIEQTLDEIVRTGKFVAPEPTYDDLTSALKHAQARYNLEKRFSMSLKADKRSYKPVLRALRQFMSVVADMINHPDGQTLQPIQPMAAPGAPLGAVPVPGGQAGAPGPGGPGIGPAVQPPSAQPIAGPAPPPLQVVPSIGAPLPLAPAA